MAGTLLDVWRLTTIERVHVCVPLCVCPLDTERNARSFSLLAGARWQAWPWPGPWKKEFEAFGVMVRMQWLFALGDDAGGGGCGTGSGDDVPIGFTSQSVSKRTESSS